MNYFSEFVFISGFIAGQLVLIIFIFLVLKLFLLNTSAAKVPKTALKLRGSKASDSKIASKFNIETQESCQFASILVAQITQIIRSDTELIAMMVERLDKQMNEYAKNTGILSGIQITELVLGEEFLQFKNARVRQEENLQVLIDFDYEDHVKFSIDTNVLVNWPKPLIGSLPISLNFTLVKVAGTMVIELESDLINPKLEKSISDYVISLYIQEDFILDFSVGSLLGHRTKVKDLPKLTDLITHSIKMAVSNTLLYPKGLKIPLKLA